MYGFRVLTSDGYKGSENIYAMRFIESHDATTTTGIVNVPKFSASRGVYLAKNYSESTFIPHLTWDETSKTLSWGKHSSSVPNGAYSNNFTIYFLEYT